MSKGPFVWFAPACRLCREGSQDRFAFKAPRIEWDDMAGLSSLWSLEGHWRLERQIKHSDGTENRLSGDVRFHRSGLQLIQDEEGVLTLGNRAMKASRRYIWSASDGRLDVYFDDMRPFHTVLLGVATHETVHLCDPDRYEVAYDFCKWPEWTVRWKVDGPRKDYAMTSHMTPV